MSLRMNSICVLTVPLTQSKIGSWQNWPSMRKWVIIRCLCSHHLHLKIASFRNEKILNKPFGKTNNRFVNRREMEMKRELSHNEDTDATEVLGPCWHHGCKAGSKHNKWICGTHSSMIGRRLNGGHTANALFDVFPHTPVIKVLWKGLSCI